MAKLTKANEYGQLELNQVAFRRDGRIIAQYQLGDVEVAENGMLLAVDHVNKTINFPENGQTAGLALNYTTEHMYDERLAYGLKHFKLEKGSFLPRLGLLATGDRFTTNAVDCNLADVKANLGTKKYYGHASDNGYITVDDASANAVLEVIAVTTMPDGSDAIKFVAI